jgi:hypothetical protein
VQQGFDRGLGTEKYLHTGGWIPFYEDFALARLGDLDVIRTSVWLVAGRNAEKPVDEKGLSKLLKDRQRPEGYQPLANRKAEGLRALILPDGSWVPHDLRRTAATMLQGLGVPPAVIDMTDPSAARLSIAWGSTWSGSSQIKAPESSHCVGRETDASPHTTPW